LLPSQIRFIFLSATIPNASQFAEWICKIHKQPCHVIYTDYRPTPLQHYVFPLNGDGIYVAMNENGEFNTDNFNKAMSVLEQRINENESKQKRWKNNSKGLYIFLIVIITLTIYKYYIHSYIYIYIYHF